MSGPDPGDHEADDETGDGHPTSSDESDEMMPSSSDDRASAGPTAAESDDNTSADRPAVTIEDDGVVRWFLRSEDGSVVFVRDIVSSVAIVAAIGLLLFAVSGVWPPLVAVESGSMEPNMERGDLIFVVDDDRFVGDGPVDATGVVTADNGLESGHDTFGQPGDVVIFRPDGSQYRTPVIHRAHFWVDEGENWVDTKADEEIIGDATCDDVQTCPASRDGFVTKGDANSGYDQHQGGAQTDVVDPDWITGKAQFRIPWLGHIRLLFDSLFGGMLAPTPAPTDISAVTTGLEAPISAGDEIVPVS
ncbi:S26 family signal peptidase [Salinadaptatus halalkaliphilus]|uniref:S26 family signal peptidase n=1 Tax=Salinadaptatus halalkaliphilus TaxID=2419781 RepID=A0A4S3TN59_9EURY|nr:S26 family signal peptidase [Salinadaptatus halalkaliphilus]THE65734.1 S26 family signal peptidase [Salinadaptatus halalkaliphilus]